jgi:hypothetical protein
MVPNCLGARVPEWLNHGSCHFPAAALAAVLGDTMFIRRMNDQFNISTSVDDVANRRASCSKCSSEECEYGSPASSGHKLLVMHCSICKNKYNASNNGFVSRQTQQDSAGLASLVIDHLLHAKT